MWPTWVPPGSCRWQCGYYRVTYWYLCLLAAIFKWVNSTSSTWITISRCPMIQCQAYPESKVHVANMGPTWVLSDPDGSHIGPMNLAIRVVLLHSQDYKSWVCNDLHMADCICSSHIHLRGYNWLPSVWCWGVILATVKIIYWYHSIYNYQLSYVNFGYRYHITSGIGIKLAWHYLEILTNHKL